MYAPRISAAKEIGRYRLGSYNARLFGDIITEGQVKYLYVLVVFASGSSEPCLYVASEVNAMADLLGGSHFLGAFDQRGHSNYGAADEWADLEPFVTRALTVAAERLRITDLAVRMPIA